MITRRLSITSILLGSISGSIAFAQDEESRALPLPNRGAFQSGDFLWPKKPGMYVPYHSGGAAVFESERARWAEERKRFLDRQREGSSSLTPIQLDTLRSLDYREFHARYAGDQKAGTPGAYSTAGGIYVGHVGIIEVDGTGTPWIVEALWDRGVVRHTYDEWLRKRPGEIVWHGRIRDVDLASREKVVAEAIRHVGKPYDFWNFDLSDDSAFYCSKLAWLSIYRTLGFAVDGNASPKRGFWFSPKQLLYTKPMARLHDPGPYAN